jgi:predicted transcriptional regulator
MNAFESQHIRNKHQVTWMSEYIIGMIGKLGGMNTSRILAMCVRHQIMSPATAHKYLKLGVEKKLLAQKWSKVDKRETEFTLTAKGEKFLEELKDGYVGK